MRLEVGDNHCPGGILAFRRYFEVVYIGIVPSGDRVEIEVGRVTPGRAPIHRHERDAQALRQEALTGLIPGED